MTTTIHSPVRADLRLREEVLRLIRALDWRGALKRMEQSNSPPDPVLFDALGSLFSRINDQERALAAFDRAVTLAPGNAHFIFNRATVYRFLGRLEEAEADYDRVIALKGTDYEAYQNRSELRTQSAGRNHIAELEAVVAKGIADWSGYVQVRYALAKENEDLGATRRPSNT